MAVAIAVAVAVVVVAASVATKEVFQTLFVDDAVAVAAAAFAVSSVVTDCSMAASL